MKKSFEVGIFLGSSFTTHILMEMNAPDVQPPMEDVLPIVIGRRIRNELTDIQRRALIQFFLERCTFHGGTATLARGAIGAAANHFNIHYSTVSKIWKSAVENKNNPNINMYTASPQRKGKCGRKETILTEDLVIEIQHVPLEQRKTIRTTAAALGVGASTIYRKIQSGDVKKLNSPLKPILSEPAKYRRLLYAASRIEKAPDGTFDDLFKASYNDIHIDEKWFDITEKVSRYYVATGEVVPTRRVQNKGHIIKVMFLVAVTRPRYDDNNNIIFDGKIGCWPFTDQVAAVRRSHNRPAGTIITRNTQVNARVYKEYILEKLLPAIREKWPRGNVQEMKKINIQHDNAPVHFNKNDAVWINSTQQFRERHRIELTLQDQPAQSPDCNVLDLGFFASLQAYHHKRPPANNIDGLVDNVMACWEQYDPMLLNRTFITHQAVCNLILEHGGDNDYKLPHLGKAALERQGALPKQLRVSDDAKQELIDMQITMADLAD